MENALAGVKHRNKIMETSEETKKAAALPRVVLIYNKKDISTNISKYLMSLTFTDYEKDQSDELNLQLKDSDKYFQNSWRPQKGDKISAQIGYEDEQLLDCGTFTIDETEWSCDDSGDVFTIRALAASVNQKIREKGSKSYKNKTLVDIAKEIASKHGYTVAGSAGFVKIPYVAQLNESDMAFLQRISAQYGYIFKLTDTVITFIPAEELDKNKPVIITDKDLEHITLRDSSTKTYNACSVKYIGKKGKLVSYTARTAKQGTKTETLKLNIKCSSKAEAKRIAEAGLRNGSKVIEGEIDLKDGRADIFAGRNIELRVNNSYSNTYHVTNTTHRITRDDYKTSMGVTA